MKKILFNDRLDLTYEVLCGYKTQTRRLVKDGTPLGSFEETMKHAPYQVGEIVAIAQSYKVKYAEMIDDLSKYNYHLLREDAAENFKRHYGHTAGWDNKFFVKAELMPRRIKTTSVRVERLQDISDYDCLKEGVRYYNPRFDEICARTGFGFTDIDKGLQLFSTQREAFAALIDRVGGKGTWESNPLVFVYDFELIR